MHIDEPRGTAVAAIGVAACITWLAYKLAGWRASPTKRPGMSVAQDLPFLLSYMHLLTQ